MKAFVSHSKMCTVFVRALLFIFIVLYGIVEEFRNIEINKKK